MTATRRTHSHDRAVCFSGWGRLLKCLDAALRSTRTGCPLASRASFALSLLVPSGTSSAAGTGKSTHCRVVRKTNHRDHAVGSGHFRHVSSTYALDRDKDWSRTAVGDMIARAGPTAWPWLQWATSRTRKCVAVLFQHYSQPFSGSEIAFVVHINLLSLWFDRGRQNILYSLSVKFAGSSSNVATVLDIGDMIDTLTSTLSCSR